MRRVTTMFLLLLGCSGDSDDDSTTTSPSAITMTPGPTTPGSATADTSSTAEPTSSTSQADTTTADPATSAPMTSDATTTSATADTTTSVTTADDTTGPPPVDCNAPPDCESCYFCARNGACKATYDACALQAFCIPTLACIESKCLDGGIQPDCPTSCCMSCAQQGTCDGVNAALACILPMCAAHCGQAMCAG